MGLSAVRSCRTAPGQRSGRGDPRVPDSVHSNHGEDATRLRRFLVILLGVGAHVPGATSGSPAPGWPFGCASLRPVGPGPPHPPHPLLFPHPAVYACSSSRSS